MRANLAVAVAMCVSLGSSAFAFERGSCGAADLSIEKLIVMPNAAGHVDWVDAIQKAQTSIHMSMYHLTDQAVINAIVAAIKARPTLDIKIILDGASLSGGYLAAIQPITAAGIKVTASSKGFTLTHTKDMVIDDRIAFISAINMTNTFNNTRDFGIITSNPAVIREMDEVFQTDLLNAQTGGAKTPTLTNPNLVWSPVNSDSKLTALIDAAKFSIVAETETLSDSDIITHLNQAASRGVWVRLVVPQCVLGNGTFNYVSLAQLVGVQFHVEVDGDNLTQPYMHSKMMLIDDQAAYIGSINYTFSSIGSYNAQTGAVTGDRELGVIFSNPEIVDRLASEFNIDWNRSQAPGATPPTCPAN